MVWLAYCPGTLRKLKQEDYHKSGASLGFRVRYCLKKKSFKLSKF